MFSLFRFYYYYYYYSKSWCRTYRCVKRALIKQTIYVHRLSQPYNILLLNCCWLLVSAPMDRHRASISKKLKVVVHMVQKHQFYGIPFTFINKLYNYYQLLDVLYVVCWNSVIKYSGVSFSDGSFYDVSLLRTLSSRTEHSRLVVHHCRNSSVLSLLRVLPVFFRCACVSSFSVLVQFFEVYCDFSIHDVHQKDREEEKIKTVDVTFFLHVFWTTAWAFFNKIKSDLIDIFFNYLCSFLYT